MESNLLISVIQERSNYNKLQGILGGKDLSDFGNVIYDIIRDYYDADPSASKVDVDILRSRVLRKYPKLGDVFDRLVVDIDSVSATNVINEYIAIKRDNLRAHMLDALAMNNDSRLSELYNTYMNLQVVEDGDGVRGLVHPNEILTQVTGANRIKLYPNSLNAVIGGGVPQATSIVLYGRPDMGKTAVVINQLFGTCRDGYKAIYFSNEDPEDMLWQRLLSRFSNMTLSEMESSPDECFNKALERGYNNLLFKSLEPGTISEIEAAVIKHNPSLIVVDQIRNLKSHDENRVTSLENAALAVRQIGKRHKCVVISCTQAGDSAEGKRVLNMSDIDSSKTGIQGQADLMIGIGGNDDDKRRGTRMLSIPKNKINGVYDAIPVRMITALSKVLSV